MLQITIPEAHNFNSDTCEFVDVARQTLTLEHSLIAISKWEAKWKKPFLCDDYVKTDEQCNDYLKCMTITQNVDPHVYDCIPKEVMAKVNAYIEESRTATTFTIRQKHSMKREIITSELIYYWMVAHQIPFECEKWHISRLITLVQVCNIKNGKPEKMSQREILAQNKALNAKRRQQAQSRG